MKRTVTEGDGVLVEQVNRTEGYSYGQRFESLADAYFTNTDPETGERSIDTGELYRFLVSEHGRCDGKAYVDGEDGQPVHVGWVFVKRERYEDTNEPFLAETWVTFARKRSPYVGTTVKGE